MPRRSCGIGAKGLFYLLGLCAVDRSNLEYPAYRARPYSALSEIIAALGSRRTELLGWMVARQFKPFMVFMASHFDYHPIFGSLAHDVTGLRFSSSPKGRDLSLEHPLGLLMVWGSTAVLFGFTYRWDSLPTDTDWVPQHDLLLFYTGCFLIGAFVYLSRIDLDAFRKHWRFYVMVGVSCAIARYFDSHHGRTLPWSGNGMRFEGYVITQALSCVSLTAGSLGLFLHSARDKSAGWRYLSDSSYWVYIVHLPLVLHLTWICLLFPIPLTAYPVAGLLLTLIVSYASYEFLVRTTWLGKLLNGRRYGAFLETA